MRVHAFMLAATTAVAVNVSTCLYDLGLGTPGAVLAHLGHKVASMHATFVHLYSTHFGCVTTRVPSASIEGR